MPRRARASAPPAHASSVFVGLLGLVGLLGACSSSDPAAPGTSASAEVTYHRDVAPIVAKRCLSCHVPGGIAPFALDSYAQAAPLAASIADATQRRIMPPWGAHDTADCKVSRPWKDDMRLTEAELETLKRWDALGAPEGDASQATPLPVVERRELAGATAFRPDVGFAMSGTEDKLRCFVIDPKFSAETFVTGTHVVPEHSQVVHHVIVFADPKGESRAKADANGQYECFGGPQVQGARMLAAWAPGGPPAELPEGVGTPIEAGALLVMQVHYHATPGVSAPPDRTSIQLRLSTTRPALFATTLLLGNFRQQFPGDVGGLMPGPNDTSDTSEFLVPPNVSSHTETMKLKMPASIRGVPIADAHLLSIGGHMHYFGVAEEIRIKRVTPSPTAPAEECLVAIPRWDFDWQRGYQFDTPIADLPALLPGDELSIRCSYDSTPANPKMGRVLREAGLSSPPPVPLGESTLEEMCLGSFVFVYNP